MLGVSEWACDRALRRGRCLKWTRKARRKQSTEDGEEESSRQKSKQGHSPGPRLSLGDRETRFGRSLVIAGRAEEAEVRQVVR